MTQFAYRQKVICTSFAEFSHKIKYKNVLPPVKVKQYLKKDKLKIRVKLY